jgi:serine protease Do
MPNKLISSAVLAVATLGVWSQTDTPQQRRTPIVEAVRRTRDGIVTVKVRKQGVRKESVGAGVIIDERGYILTTRHVIKNGVGVRVLLRDQTSCPAVVDFDDPSHDLAVLKISTSRKLKALRLGPASDLMVGEEVIAIGHPFGYTNTVSRGIISALGREVEMPGGVTLTGLIQITASINPGNSGGPLLNINGELIGINVALRQDAQGIAFALNADQVQQVLSKRLSASRLSGVCHGLTCRPRVDARGSPRQRVVVTSVAGSSPARSAGLKRDDEIVSVGGQMVANSFDLERSLWDRKPGERVRLKVLRQGREIRVPLTLAGEEQSSDRPAQ